MIQLHGDFYYFSAIFYQIAVSNTQVISIIGIWLRKEILAKDYVTINDAAPTTQSLIFPPTQDHL